MIELKCPACQRYLGEFEGAVRLRSCPNCRSEVYAETTTSGLQALQFTLAKLKGNADMAVKVAL